MISQQPIDTGGSLFPTLSLGWIMVIIFLAVIGIVIYLIYKASSGKKETTDHFKKEYEHIRTLCANNTDPRYYSSQWRPTKNARLIRHFKEHGEYVRLDAQNGYTSYHGHFLGKNGALYIAFSFRKEYMILPIIDVLVAPETSVHFHPQLREITLDCVAIDQLSESLFFHPVYKTADGKVILDGLGAVEKGWEERMATEVIKKQGDAALTLANRMPLLNADLQYKRKDKPSEGE